MCGSSRSVPFLLHTHREVVCTSASQRRKEGRKGGSKQQLQPLVRPSSVESSVKGNESCAITTSSQKSECELSDLSAESFSGGRREACVPPLRHAEIVIS
jgi:hypothetical protein